MRFVGFVFGEDILGVVHVVDDDTSFRAAVQRRLKTAGYEVATYASAEQLLDHRPDDCRRGCIVLDVCMPGLDGPELQQRLGELGSALPIVFLSAYTDVKTTVQTIKAGAEDFLVKPVASEQLIAAIERAMARHEHSRQLNGNFDMMRSRVASLTPRERQVFERVVRGRMNKEIARELGSTERTVKAHRQRVMEKMKVQSLAELVSTAERLGLMRSNDEAGTVTIGR